MTAWPENQPQMQQHHHQQHHISYTNHTTANGSLLVCVCVCVCLFPNTPPWLPLKLLHNRCHLCLSFLQAAARINHMVCSPPLLLIWHLQRVVGHKGQTHTE